MPAYSPTHPLVATVEARLPGVAIGTEWADLAVSVPNDERDAELLIEVDGQQLSLRLTESQVQALRGRLDACLGEQRATIPAW